MRSPLGRATSTSLEHMLHLGVGQHSRQRRTVAGEVPEGDARSAASVRVVLTHLFGRCALLHVRCDVLVEIVDHRHSSGYVDGRRHQGDAHDAQTHECGEMQTLDESLVGRLFRRLTELVGKCGRPADGVADLALDGRAGCSRHMPQRTVECLLDRRPIDARGQASHDCHPEGAAQQLHRGAYTRTRTDLVGGSVPTIALDAGAMVRPMPKPTRTKAIVTGKTPDATDNVENVTRPQVTSPIPTSMILRSPKRAASRAARLLPKMVAAAEGMNLMPTSKGSAPCTNWMYWLAR